MSTSSCEENAGMASHSATSSGLESTGSLLFSVPSDYSSDVQTEITPSSSPTPSEGKMRMPRDILDASRRLGQISVSALQVDVTVTPTKPPKQLCHRASSSSVTNDEAGYDADGDGDEDEGADAGARAGAPGTTRPIRRPAFLRIDTRQHRRVASMLAIRRPSPGFEDVDDMSHPLHASLLAPLSSIRLKSTAATATTTTASGGGGGGGGGDGESYELREKARRRAEPVGLGIGFPENHPLRSRAFTMPVPRTSMSPVDDDPGPSMRLEGMQMQIQMEKEKEKERRSLEWLPSPAQWLKKTVQGVGVRTPSSVPVRKLALRPTFLELSPSPIDHLPGAVAGTGALYCDVDAHDRAEVSERDHGHCHAMGMSVSDAEIEQERYALAQGCPVIDLHESARVTLHARSEVAVIVQVGLQSGTE